MLEHFIVYERATGALCFRAAVQPGVAAQQEIGEGRAILLLPAAAISGDGIDLDMLKAALVDRIDAEAEAIRLRFITPGAGQALTYQYKADEARAWTADRAAPTPFLTAEADARGIPLADLVAEVIGQVDLWTAVGSRIEALRLGAKVTIATATTPEAALRAGMIEWEPPVPAIPLSNEGSDNG